MTRRPTARNRRNYVTAPADATPTFVITSVSRTAGKAAGGTTLTVTATGITGTPTSTLGTVSSVTATTFVVTTSSHAAGAVSWTATNGNGQVSASQTFTYLAAPTVSAISPNNGPATITNTTAYVVTGTGFPPAGSGVTVTVAVGTGALGGVSLVNSTTLNATSLTAPGAGADNVVATVDGVASTGGTGLYTGNAAPTISNVTAISTSGGTATMTGTNYVSLPTVSANINGSATSLTVIFANATHLDLTLAAGSYTAGAWDITVTNPDGQSATAAGALTISAFDPSTFPGYLFEYPPSGIVNSAGVVGTWNDSGPSSLALTQATTARKGTYVASSLNGFAGVQGIAANQTHLESSSSFTWGTKAASIYLVGKFVATGGVAMVFETTAAADSNNGIWSYVSNSNFFNCQDGSGGAASAPALAATQQVLAFLYDGSGGPFGVSIYYGRNCLNWSAAIANGSNFASDVFSLFSRKGSFAFPSSGTWNHIIGYNALHTTSQVQQVITNLSNKYALNVSPTRSLYVDGDSMSTNYANLGSSWPSQVAFSGSFNATDLGSCAYLGKLLATGYANRVAQSTVINPGLVTDSILWLGTNDFSTTPATVPSTLYNGTLLPYVAYRQGLGDRNVGIMTMLPRQSNATVESDRIAWNTLIRNGAVANGYTVIDVGGDATIGAPGSQNNATYYQADLTHLTIAGQNIVYTTYIAPTLTTWA